MKMITIWREIETGQEMTYHEMCAVLEEKYDFDDWTPWTEAYEYFEKVRAVPSQAD